jgi:phosphoketolase
VGALLTGINAGPALGCQGGGMSRALQPANSIAQRWAEGFGVIEHTPATQRRIAELAHRLVKSDKAATLEKVYAVLAAADRLTSATMWVIVHMTYADRMDLTGAPLPAEAFKQTPEGHTGGSLNVAPAYVAYLAANALSGETRGWLLGQGHCVAAIEAANALAGNLSDTQSGRYGWDQAGLSHLAADFYSYAIDAQGRPTHPLGSHVNAHTAGGLSEGGYLGFAEIEYVHMPLPGEKLVAILSDGAFEEQRGSDWSERWWRAADCGLVAPVMILNGRRIEQRSEIAQDGGAAWLIRHLEANGFDPFEVDGRDPAALVWAIFECERRLEVASDKIARGEGAYPVRLPYAIARTVKGFGFPGAGTNRAHNLPLEGSPRTDEAVRDEFNAAAARLFVPQAELGAARLALSTHEIQGRPKERDNVFAHRAPPAPVLPPASAFDGAISPMAAIDDWFVEFVRANPGRRFRVGNPDELRSNQMGATLDLLKHRVNRPEAGAPEAIDGRVITALNEEAAVGAALGDKGGLNLVVSYEAFAVKMLGALRQEIIFARQQVEIGRPPQWIGTPVIATSHTWENGKNQQSHQDPTFAEALLGEMSDVARVLFPADAATAVEALRRIYASRGVIAGLVVPKRPLPAVFDAKAAARLLELGAGPVEADPEPQVQLLAVGAYQLVEARRAAARLRELQIPVLVTCIVEPGRLRQPRDEIEARVTISDSDRIRLFPVGLPRVLATHTRAEAVIGVLRRIDEGAERFLAHGYRNRGGTLDTFGMLFANRCTWAHLTHSAARVLGLDPLGLLDSNELAAVAGVGDPAVLR